MNSKDLTNTKDYTDSLNKSINQKSISILNFNQPKSSKYKPLHVKFKEYKNKCLNFFCFNG